MGHKYQMGRILDFLKILYFESILVDLRQSLQEMRLSGSYQNCSEDFLQFGRDVLFITTHLRLELRKFYLCLHLNCVSPSFRDVSFSNFVFSDKVCGTILPAPAQAPLSQLHNGNTSLLGREPKFSTEKFLK